MRWSWHKVTIVIAILLIVGGGFYIVQPIIRAAITRHTGQQQNTQKLQAAAKDLVAVNNTFALRDPVSVSLPRLAINLEVKQGFYNAKSQTWTLDRTNAFMMQPWSQDGKVFPATPVIYGHNISAVFMHLDGAATDEMLTITQADGKTYTLKYVGDVKAQPHDVSALRTHIPDTVLLMTCTGVHFEERRILRFEVVGSQQAAYVPVGATYVLA